MLKLEVYDPPMCCATGVCGTNVDLRLVTFASDLEWLKKQGVEVIRYGLSFQPAEFVKNEMVKNTLQAEGNDCLPIVILNNEVVFKGEYPTREKLAGLFKIPFKADEQDFIPVKMEESVCCDSQCDCSNAPAEDNCCCPPDCDCHKSDVNDTAKKIIFVIVLLAIAAILAFKFGPSAGAAAITKNGQSVASEKFGENIDSLNQVNSNQTVAFIYIPRKANEKISSKIKSSMLSAQKTLTAKNIKTSLYILNYKSAEYPQIVSNTVPPAVLTLYKGKNKNYVSGIINPTRLLQSYIATTQEGPCGAGCPCHKK